MASKQDPLFEQKVGKWIEMALETELVDRYSCHFVYQKMFKKNTLFIKGRISGFPSKTVSYFVNSSTKSLLGQ